MKIVLVKEHTGQRPTGIGWLLIALITFALLYACIANIYPFLAPTKQPHKGLLVVEGWIHDKALEKAVAIYREGDYSRIICVGGPFELGSHFQQFDSYPEMTAARLTALGIDSAEIIIATSKRVKQDRTYMSAIAMREKLQVLHLDEPSIHLVTIGTHGRRSRLLFQKALGKNYTVGVTSLDPTGYNPEQWFLYSEGVRGVLDELIAYAYAKLLFRPSHS